MRTGGAQSDVQVPNVVCDLLQGGPGSLETVKVRWWGGAFCSRVRG